MPIRVRRHIRKMRGGAQSQLMECDDGAFYVVKYCTNPQHRRILPNEWIAYDILRYLGISVPETAIVEVTQEFIREYPEAGIQLGARQISPEPGWHFGSKYPGNPERMATYEFLPEKLLATVHNLRDFLGALVFDKWVGNADGRQSVFFRAQIRDWLPSAEENPRNMGFIASMIDHGYAFNGGHWDYINSPVQGLYSQKSVYNGVSGLQDFQPWLDRVIYFPEHVLDEALRGLPPDWIRDDADAIEKLLDQLVKRRKRVPELIEDARRAKTNPFAHWPA